MGPPLWERVHGCGEKEGAPARSAGLPGVDSLPTRFNAKLKEAHQHPAPRQGKVSTARVVPCELLSVYAPRPQLLFLP